MNPYFTMNESINSLLVNRVFGKSSLYYQPFDFLKLEGRVGLDYVNSQRFERNYFNFDHLNGSFNENKNDRTELNVDFLANFNKQYGDFSVLGTAGVNYRDYKMSMNELGATGLNVLGIYTITNKIGPAEVDMDHAHNRSNSIYGQASVGWRDQLYVDVTARNDWSSTLTKSFFIHQ